MRIVSGTIRPTPLQWLPVLSHITPPAVRRTELSANFIHNFQRKPYVPPVHQDIFNHPASHLPSRRPIWSTANEKTSGELSGRLIFQLTPRSLMTQLFPCLVPTCPDVSGAFWTVSTQELADVQPVSISGVTPTSHAGTQYLATE